MALDHKARKRLSLLLLVVWMPVYVVVAVTIVGYFDRPHILVEILIYVILGALWALPFRRVFLGVGREDPDGGSADDKDGRR